MTGPRRLAIGVGLLCAAAAIPHSWERYWTFDHDRKGLPGLQEFLQGEIKNADVNFQRYLDYNGDDQFLKDFFKRDSDFAQDYVLKLSKQIDRMTHPLHVVVLELSWPIIGFAIGWSAVTLAAWVYAGFRPAAANKQES